MVTLKDIYYRPVLDQVMISVDGATCQILHEGKWIPGSFDRNIRIDQPTHGRGQIHAHILGRKGNEIGVVNIDGHAGADGPAGTITINWPCDGKPSSALFTSMDNGLDSPGRWVG